MDISQLFNALVGQGILSADAAERVKQEAASSGKAPEEILYEKRLAESGAVAEVKAKLLSVPYQKINFDALDEGLKDLVPEETARVYKVAPLAREKDLLVIGMVYPDDLKAQEALKFIARRLRMSLGVYLISYADWEAALRKYSPYKSGIEAAVKGFSPVPSGGSPRLVELEKGEASSVEAPVIRIVAETLREAVESKASDVHIEPQQNYLRVRFRVDGKLKEIASLPLELAPSVVSRVKVVSNLKIDETRIPQDGRFRSKIFNREIDFRVSTFPTPLGEKVAIRVLDPTTGLKTLDQLGLTGKNAEMLRSALAKPFGMILATGPTGSGKTTTLYAILQILNGENMNIVSLEDPVEYFVPGVNQSQVQPEIGYDFASGLRQILRQDPDVILVGEIRDNETAGLGVHAALT
ncbi:MAG: ATPase, T2SS/T4P/T4SS family, partial [Patescibacteria group bacterium]